MGTRDPRQTRFNVSEPVGSVVPYSLHVEQSPALDSAVTHLTATQGMMAEHMFDVVSGKREHNG